VIALCGRHESGTDQVDGRDDGRGGGA